MITRADALLHVGLEPEYADDTDLAAIDSAIQASCVWLQGAAGRDVDYDNPISERLLLLAVGELYDERRLTDTRVTQKRYSQITRMAGDLLMQLRYAAPPVPLPPIVDGFTRTEA